MIKDIVISDFTMTSFPSIRWVGKYVNGCEVIKIAYENNQRELLIVYFVNTEDDPPALVRYCFLVKAEDRSLLILTILLQSMPVQRFVSSTFPDDLQRCG